MSRFRLGERRRARSPLTIRADHHRYAPIITIGIRTDQAAAAG
jgi:hypothetical protein